jgi:putative metallohydrolase (TIGR04338 family)
MCSAGTAGATSYRTFRDVDEARVYLGRVLDSRWYLDYEVPRVDEAYYDTGHKKSSKVEMKAKRDPSCAWARWQCLIELPNAEWALNNIVVLHELAHCVTNEHPAHGRQFARVLLDFVELGIGKAAREAFEECYRRFKVQWSVRKPSTAFQQTLAAQRCPMAQVEWTELCIQRLESDSFHRGMVSLEHCRRFDSWSVYVDWHGSWKRSTVRKVAHSRASAETMFVQEVQKALDAGCEYDSRRWEEESFGN